MFAKVIVSIGLILESELFRRTSMTAFPLIFLVFVKIQFKIAKNNNSKISIWLISKYVNRRFIFIEYPGCSYI